MKSETLSLKTILNELDVASKTGIIQWNAWKKGFAIVREQINKKIRDPRNAKEHYQSFMRKKNTKSVKQSETSTYQPKTFENPNIVGIKQLLQNIQKFHISYPRL